MMKQIAGCAIILGGLIVWDRVMTANEDELKANTVRVGRIVSKEERERKTPAAIVIETQGGDKFTFVKTAPEIWKCSSYRNAIASTERIERGLINKLFESEGHVQSDDSKLAAQYGLDVAGMFIVTVHGDGFIKNKGADDVIAKIDIGAAAHDRDGCFMRRHGEQKIWAMDSNPHPELDRPAQVKIPPLLDPSIIPMYWLSSAQRVAKIKVERSGAAAYELEVRDIQITPEEMKQGKSPFEWYYKKTGVEDRLCEQTAAVGYTSILMRAPYSDVLDVAMFSKLGFDKPAAKLTLTPGQGTPMEIFLGGVMTPNRKFAIYNAATQAIYEVEPGLVEYVFPKEGELITPGRNVWKPLMDQMSGAGAAPR
ncbi:MAG: DUF4340 domain-containing protein [Planctomycetota bacterium]